MFFVLFFVLSFLVFKIFYIFVIFSFFHFFTFSFFHFFIFSFFHFFIFSFFHFLLLIVTSVHHPIGKVLPPTPLWAIPCMDLPTYCQSNFHLYPLLRYTILHS